MKRNASLDIIRGFAVVLVACLHSIGNGSLTANHISGVSGYLLTGLWLLSASCVPLFLMLSGYLQNRKTPTVKYYVNYLHIYIPYLLLGVISLTVGALYTHQSLSVRDFVSSLVNFYTCEYSWFVMMYTGLFLLLPFLNAMYNGLETKGQKQELLCRGWFLPPNTYDCGSFVVNGTAVVGKEPKKPYNRCKSTQKGAELYEISI